MTSAKALVAKHKDQFQKKHGVPLGLLSLFVKAASNTLQEIPEVNAVIDDQSKEIVFRDYVDLSVPIPSPRGPVSCVLANAESLSVAAAERELSGLVQRARQDQLTFKDLAGGSFGISDAGSAGGMLGTLMLNPPMSAMLGTNAVTMRAAVVDGEVKARPMMSVALTYDHRLIDGKEAVTFLCSVRDKLEDPARLLLDL